MQNDPKVTEKRSLRVRNGIEVKCVRLLKVKHLGSTSENQEVIECFVKARLPDQSFVKQLLDILQTK